MAPNLQGLNIVHQNPPQSLNPAQDLLSAPPYPDLSAQLDLWTNLAFESDEPLIHSKDRGTKERAHADGDEEDDAGMPTEGSAEHESHDNVVTGTTESSSNDHNASQQHQQQPAFDISHFLAGFGLDPFLVSPQQQHTVPSLAQLLAMQPPPPGVSGFTAESVEKSYNVRPAEEEGSGSFPAPKRTRTRKSSVSSTMDSVAGDDVGGSNGTPLSAAEDKRRRNTAASARFRLKKKEREMALEKRAKDLEGKVGELERECEGLRRENGWLKGLVVGVTGSAPQNAPGSSSQTATAGSKRGRDDADRA
ncbi:hypothetical protein PLICRDRAFT_37465 [Plicaturopsis crispa FD-325 SS-3]|nr:hypothetical protein PLICRDRAFT_37465 [Plicaturopsis crispa FD-325 SS-3]